MRRVDLQSVSRRLSPRPQRESRRAVAFRVTVVGRDADASDGAFQRNDVLGKDEGAVSSVEDVEAISVTRGSLRWNLRQRRPPSRIVSLGDEVHSDDVVGTDENDDVVDGTEEESETDERLVRKTSDGEHDERGFRCATD